MTWYRMVPLALTTAVILACLGGSKVDTQAAESELKAGRLPEALDAYSQLVQDNPESIDAAVGKAYMLMLKGDYGAADETLRVVEEFATEEQTKEIQLRRALVALRAGNLDDVKKYGKASRLAAGSVLAAEVHLADAETEDAVRLLKVARDEAGPIGQTATTYLEYLESGDALMSGLAEASALWALGQRDVACEAAKELVKALPDGGDKANRLLVWAGRAVTSGRPGVATSLMDELDLVGYPPGQEWRVRATRAMIHVSEGAYEQGLEEFETLKVAVEQGYVPVDGVNDARATAAALAKDPQVADQLVAGLQTVAAARGLVEAGNTARAKKVVPPGTAFARYLESM